MAECRKRAGKPSTDGPESTSSRVAMGTWNSRMLGIEYDDRDGRRGVEDLEVITPHYRGAHAAAKAAAGFYAVSGQWRTRRRGQWPWSQWPWRRPAPGGGAAPVTPQERIAAVEKQGFTVRQAGFLVTVMLHSGVCMLRQYCAYAHLVHGQKTRDFFSTLVARRLATAYSAAHRRARIFHIHSKRLYTVISEPNNRNRKPITLGRAIERLMILDAVIAEPQMRWLGSEKEKVEYFRQATSLRAR